jgi:hypothetical protein
MDHSRKALGQGDIAEHVFFRGSAIVPVDSLEKSVFLGKPALKVFSRIDF